MLASDLEDVEHRPLIQTAQAACGPHAQALAKHLDHLRGLRGVHSEASHRARFAKGFPALQALEPADHAVPVSKTAKSLGIAIAANTRHLTLSKRGRKVAMYRKIRNFGPLTPFVAASRCYQHRGAFCLWKIR